MFCNAVYWVQQSRDILQQQSGNDTVTSDHTKWHAHRLKGKILYELKNLKASGESYNAALRTQPNLLPAWKGLAELHSAAENYAEAVVAFQALVSKAEHCACWTLNMSLSSFSHPTLMSCFRFE